MMFISKSEKELIHERFFVHFLFYLKKSHAEYTFDDIILTHNQRN